MSERESSSEESSQASGLGEIRVNGPQEHGVGLADRDDMAGIKTRILKDASGRFWNMNTMNCKTRRHAEYAVLALFLNSKLLWEEVEHHEFDFVDVHDTLLDTEEAWAASTGMVTMSMRDTNRFGEERKEPDDIIIDGQAVKWSYSGLGSVPKL